MNTMIWVLVVLIGSLVGLILNVLTKDLRMPLLLSVAIGILGASVGSALFNITGSNILGAGTAIVSAAVFSICLSAGAVLAYSLTFANKRNQ